jgi:GNAT superfamily N-acetyltransferase
MQFQISERTPTVKEYNALRHLADWPVLDERMVEIGLANSLYTVVIEDKNGIIGMGRVVGDNAIYLHISDLIVSPDFQKQGVGSIIMKELLKYVDSVASKGTNIGLMCSKGREPFYKSFGFLERPNDKFGAGMIKVK